MPTSKQETQHQSILHLWNNGIRNAKEIYAQTTIPLTTIYDNIRKLKKTGTIKHAGGNGQPKKITVHESRAIGQYLHHDPRLSAKTLFSKQIVKQYH